VTTVVETAEIIEPWIYSLLNADTELASVVGEDIFGPQAPAEIDTPYVTVVCVSPRDMLGVGTHRIQVEALYDVKVTAPGFSVDTILPAAKRINALMDGVRNATYAGGQITCVRERIISYSDQARTNRGSGPGGDPYVHLGSTFRITASAG
jgi:hypothetical protein